MIIERKLSKASERVICSISTANYITAENGRITLKNSPRLRLLIDKGLFVENGFLCDRLKFKKFDIDRMGLIFEVADDGVKASVIKKGSGRMDYSLPLNHKSVPEQINPRIFPLIRKSQCRYVFEKDYFIVLLPIEYIKE